MQDPSPQSLAQTELASLVQGRTRLFALGLAGLNGCAGLINQVLTPSSRLDMEGPFAALTVLSMVALARWMKEPRPAFMVNFAGGTAALLAVTSALLHLSVSQDLQNTTHLLLILTGAGYFLFSLSWFLGVAGFAALGWGVVALEIGPTAYPLDLGVEVATAILLGLLIHLVRRDLLNRFLALLVQKHEREAEQARLMRELQDALDHVKTLHGLIPICAECKKIRDDQGYWQQVEDYVHEHSEAVFSHSLCPICLDRAKAEFEAYQNEGSGFGT